VHVGVLFGDLTSGQLNKRLQFGKVHNTSKRNPGRTSTGK
jgi:hypothetical protein